MLSSVPTHATDLARRFRRAVDSGRMNEAEALLAQLPKPLPADLCLPVGRLYASQRRWAQAAEALARVARPDGFGQMLLNLSRNLAEMQTHRPAVYERLIASTDQGKYTIGSGVGGKPVIISRGPDGSLTSLAPQNDPLANVRRALSEESGYPKGGAIGLLGIGDGHVLNAMARHPPQLYMDTQQVVHLLEPDTQLVMTCLMAHDYSGDTGPIRQPRIRWHVGADCGDTYESSITTETMLAPAAITVAQGEACAAIVARVRQAHERLAAAYYALRDRVAGKYDASFPARAGDALAGRLGRKPRILFLTTRFTTVLQYSTRDAADAARRAGFDTDIFIEPSPHHCWTRTAILQAIDRFEPDVLFQIDHLRYEHGDLFPPSLPFVCWIQDHLPNLTTTTAGKSMAANPNDFVMAEYPFGYIDRFGYSADRCLAVPKLTRPTSPAEPCPQDGDDLVYVSNASGTPAEMIERLLSGHERGSHAYRLLDESARRIVAVYEAGGNLSNRYEVQQIADQAAVDLGIGMQRATREQVALSLAHPLNNALYRQQTLEWAATIAADRGLSMAIYGNGWDRHPTLGRHARGPVAYGKALETLTRRSRINLQVVPFSCMHQRLLDGLSAGGFFLVRLSTTDVLMRRLHALLSAAGLPPTVRSREAAMDALDPAGREILSAVLRDGGALGTSDLIDPVELVRSAEAAGLLVKGSGDLIPHLDRTGFRSAGELALAIDQFRGDEAARQRIAAEQWAHLADRVTYDAGIARTMRWLAAKLDAARSEVRAAA
jgi:hypothetical protein